MDCQGVLPKFFDGAAQLSYRERRRLVCGCLPAVAVSAQEAWRGLERNCLCRGSKKQKMPSRSVLLCKCTRGVPVLLWYALYGVEKV